MAWSITYNERLNFLEVKSSGVFNFEEDARLVQEVKNKSDQYGCMSLLIDHRLATVDFKLISIYDRPALYEKYHYTKSMKAALVFKTITENSMFFENVCVNRGFNIKVFSDYDKAVNWLISA